MEAREVKVEWREGGGAVDAESLLREQTLENVLDGISSELFVEWLKVWGRWRDWINLKGQCASCT